MTSPEQRAKILRPMSPIKEHCIFTLTPDDVDRIRGLLRSVEVAIGELVAYRCVRPLAANVNFRLEDEVYQQTSQILADCDGPF
jgi:hypothetical protein